MIELFLFSYHSDKGPLNSYVDKKNLKMSVFVHTQGIKTVHAGGGGGG